MREERVYTNMLMWRDIRRRVLVEGESKRHICREYGYDGGYTAVKEAVRAYKQKSCTEMVHALSIRR